MAARSRSLLTRVVAGVAAASLVASLLPAGAAAAATEPDWGPCPAGSVVPEGADVSDYECATVPAPLSYRDPDGAQVTLAVGRLPARDQSRKLGSLFYNPGGPGNPGRLPPALTEVLHERFDIVGFDPRGIGASDPLRCLSTPEDAEPLGRVFGTFPTDADEHRRYVADVEAVAETCDRNAGPLLDHMSTANVAKDLDVLRAALGERRLHYVGHSYGTQLGSVYANLFPHRVGGAVLDAVEDPVAWTTGYGTQGVRVPLSYRLGSHRGAAQALRSFLDTCADDERCAFREPGVDLAEKYGDLLDRLARGPVTIEDPQSGEQRQVRYQDFAGMVVGALEDAASSPGLAAFLQAVHEAQVTAQPAAGRAGPDLAAANAAVAGGATVCADSTNPDDPDAWRKYARKADRVARGMGSLLTYKTIPCAIWQDRDPDRYTGPWDRDTANPLLLVGNSGGDPATPYEGAQRAERLLANARLLTLDTFGHGAIGRSACVDTAVERYLVTGRLSAAGTSCQPDRTPFDAG